jgi:hypothetical protein
MRHPFQQKFIIQNIYELRKFCWFFHYKKQVGQKIIPTGLCEICNRLEIEHNDN